MKRYGGYTSNYLLPHRSIKITSRDDRLTSLTNNVDLASKLERKPYIKRNGVLNRFSGVWSGWRYVPHRGKEIKYRSLVVRVFIG